MKPSPLLTLPQPIPLPTPPSPLPAPRRNPFICWTTHSRPPSRQTPSRKGQGAAMVILLRRRLRGEKAAVVKTWRESSGGGEEHFAVCFGVNTWGLGVDLCEYRIRIVFL